MLRTKTFRGLPFLLNPPIADKAWVLKINSSPESSHDIFLNFSGRIEGRGHFSEYLWRVEDYKLLILDKNSNIVWQSNHIKYKKDGKIIISLSDSKKSVYAILEEKAIIKNKESHLESEFLYGKDVSVAVTDSQFLFPRELEMTPTFLSRVLIIGSSIAALAQEQLSQQYPDIVFDFVSHEYLSPLPDLLNSYDFVYFQPSLRSVIGDSIVWGERFNNQGFSEHVTITAEANLEKLIQYINEYSSVHKVFLLVTNFLCPQLPPVTFPHSDNVNLSSIIQRLNDKLMNGIGKNKFVKYLDLESLFSIIGKRYVLDDIIYFYSHNGIIFQDWDDFSNFSEDSSPLENLNNIYPNKYEFIGKILFGQMIWGLRTVQKIDCVKAVIFNLDNTLWRGNLSKKKSEEEKFSFVRQDGWPMGIWETIHYLRARNIKIIIYSDGDKNFVKKYWEKIIEPHFLSLNDFDYVEIGSSPIKVTLSDICQKLALSLDDIVVVEASSKRRTEFANAFPNIRVIGHNPYLTRRILLWAAETQTHIKPTTLLY